MRKHLAFLTLMVSSAFAGEDIPVTIYVLSGGEQCSVFGKPMLCTQVVKFLQDTEVPLDHAVGVYAEGQGDLSRTKPVVDLIRAAGYTRVQQGYFQKGAPE